MNTRDLINFGNTRGLRTVNMPLDGQLPNGLSIDRLNYSELMTIFMNQGVVIDRAYIEIRDDNFSLTLHGADGNMMHIKLKDVISARLHRKLPVPGDFMIEAAENRSLVEEQTIAINRAIPVSSNQSRNRSTDQVRNANSGVVALDAELGGNRYRYSTHTTIVNNLQTSDDIGIEIGISGLSIPVIARSVRGNVGVMQGINTSLHRQPGAPADPVQLYYCPDENPNNAPNIPLTYHMVSNQRAYGYQTRTFVQSCRIISRQNTSLVKETFPSEYDSMRLKVLAKMPKGTIQRAISKIKKSVPFGRINISLDHTEEGEPTLFCYVTNEIHANGTVTNSVVKSTDLTEHIVYCASEEKTVATMSYPTWMDNAKTTRQGSISFANIANRICRDVGRYPDGNGDYEEFIGINECNNLVYGVIDTLGLESYIGTIATLEAPLDFDIPEVVVKKKTKKRVARDIIPAEALVVPEELGTNHHYIKWKIHSDAWHIARNLQCPVDLAKVFTGYINSGEEVTEEDITEFGRLNS